MKKIVLVSLVIILLLSLIISGCSAPASTPTSSPASTPASTPVQAPASSKVIELKFATQQAPTSDAALVDERFGEMVSKATGGRVKITYFHAESLGKAVDFLDMTKAGICDISDVNAGLMAGQFDGLFTAIGLPLLGIPSRDAAHKLIWDLYLKGYHKYDTGMAGFKVIGFQTVSPARMFLRDKVVTAEGMKGYKIRTPDANVGKMLKQMGATQIVMSGSEVYMSLERKMIDGAITTPEYFLASKWYEVVKYCMFNAVSVSSGPLLMNMNVWNDLPTDIQAIMDKVIDEYKNEFTSYYSAKDANVLNQMKQNGVDIYEVESGEWAKFKEAAATIRDQWIADKEAKGLPAKEMMEYIQKSVSN